MTRTPLLIMLAAAAALAGCNENHTIGGDADQNAANSAEANANVQLPPSILSTKLYRCADNSVVTVDYLSDNKSAHVKAGENGAPVQVTMAEPGKPMTSADGTISLEGSPTSSSAKIAVPGHPAQTCNA
jgi:hypothetical protein